MFFKKIMEKEEELMNTKQAVSYTGYERNTLAQYRSLGILSGVKKQNNKKEFFYKKADLDSFIEGRKSLNKYTKDTFKKKAGKLKVAETMYNYWVFDTNLWEKEMYSKIEAEELSKTMKNSYKNINCSYLEDCMKCENCHNCKNIKNVKNSFDFKK